jgi:hypothetical protein
VEFNAVSEEKYLLDVINGKKNLIAELEANPNKNTGPIVRIIEKEIDRLEKRLRDVRLGLAVDILF